MTRITYIKHLFQFIIFFNAIESNLLLSKWYSNLNLSISVNINYISNSEFLY